MSEKLTPPDGWTFNNCWYTKFNARVFCADDDMTGATGGGYLMIAHNRILVPVKNGEYFPSPEEAMWYAELQGLIEDPRPARR